MAKLTVFDPNRPIIMLSVYETSNMLIASVSASFDQISVRGPLSNGYIPTVQDVFDAVKGGEKIGHVRRKLGLAKEQMSRALSIISSKEPEFARIFVDKGKRLSVAFVDACLTPQIIPFLSKKHRIAALHVNYTGLKDKSDQEIFYKAREEGAQVIITVDKRSKKPHDLAKVAQQAVIDIMDSPRLTQAQKAQELKKLPVIIRVSQSRNARKGETYKATIKRFNRFEAIIHEFIRLKPGPYITLNEEGVTVGKTNSQIYDEFKYPPPLDTGKTRRQSDAEKYEKKMLARLVLRGMTPKEISQSKRRIRKLAWDEAERVQRRAGERRPMSEGKKMQRRLRAA